MKNPIINPNPLDAGNDIPAGHLPKELAQDARTGALRALREFLACIIFHRKGDHDPLTDERGAPFSFRVPKKNIHVEWPDDEVTRVFPTISLIASGEGDYEHPGMGPRILECDLVPNHPEMVFTRAATLTEEITIELWASNKAERSCLRAGIEHIMNPSEEHIGLRLRVAQHHNTIAHFMVLRAANIDEEDGIRNRRRALIRVMMRMPILVAVRKPVLVVQVPVSVE